MLQRMQEYELFRCTETRGSLGESAREWRSIGTIRAAVSAASGGTEVENLVCEVKSSHLGVTWDDVRTGDRFGGYLVDYIVEGPRCRLLYLNRREVPGDAEIA